MLEDKTKKFFYRNVVFVLCIVNRGFYLLYHIYMEYYNNIILRWFIAKNITQSGWVDNKQ